MRAGIRVLIAVVVAGLVPTAGPAATLTATPATVAAVFAAARPGDAIRLAAGDYPPIELHARQWNPAVTVDASAGRFSSVALREVSGLSWHGGTFDGGDALKNGFGVNRGDHLVVDGLTMHHYLRNGVGIGMASDVRITGNRFSDMGSDGIDIALSRRIVVDHNRCSDTHPTPGAHPDCVQLWSRPTAPPTADITITNNEAVGDTQGFTAFNHVRDGVDDGGFDRITVENNVARVGSYHGVTLMDCRKCVVRNNRAEAIPNPAIPKMRAWIKVVRGTDTVACGNIAKDFPGDVGSERCRDGR